MLVTGHLLPEELPTFPSRWHIWPMPAWSYSWDWSGSCSTRGWRVLHLPEAGGFSTSLQQTPWIDCVQLISSTSATCTLTTSGRLSVLCDQYLTNFTSNLSFKASNNCVSVLKFPPTESVALAKNRQSAPRLHWQYDAMTASIEPDSIKQQASSHCSREWNSF